MSNPLQRLRESLLAAPIIWKGDYPYFIHPLTDGVPRLDPSVLTAVVELIEDAVQWDSIDLILGIEAMGLPLTSPLSMRNNRPQVVVRKRSYGLEGELSIDQSTGKCDVIVYETRVAFIVFNFYVAVLATQRRFEQVQWLFRHDEFGCIITA